jgi:hypothetical protein
VNGLNTKAIGIAVIVVILLLGGGYFLSKSKNTTPSTSNTATASATPEASGGQTMAQLLTMGGNKKCTFEVNGSGGGSTKGTLYISDANVKGDIVMTTSTGKIQTNHIIRVGDQNYIWGDTFPGGIKMKLSINDLTNNAQASQTFNPNTKANFNCVTWNVDQSAFFPPTNIKFIDVGSMMGTTPTGASNGESRTTQPNNYQCAACAALTGDNKTSCMTIYHCQ